MDWVNGMKRFLGIVVCLLLLAAPIGSLADFDYESIPTPYMLIVDADDPSAVFYERAADQRAFPASTTKIMTCLLAVEAGNLDDQVTVGEEVTPFTNYSSLMGLKSGETVTMRDLIFGLMLPSGNDAGAAIAVHVAGSIEAFVKMMNDRAAQLNMTGTHFTNPHGVHNDEHYSTARDLAKLMSYALQNDAFCQIDQTKTYTVPATNLSPERVLTTTNRLMVKVEGDPVDTVYPYAVGGKTGDTDMAGKCLVAVAERDGARVIAVLLGDKAEMYNGDTVANNLARFVNAKSIFEHVFNTQYATVTIEELGLETTFYTGVANANEADLVSGRLSMSAVLTDSVIRARQNQIESYRANASAIIPNVELTADAHAPIAQGQSMGVVRYTLGNATIFTAPLTADFAVDAVHSADVVNPQGTAVITDAPDATPLLTRRRIEWNTQNVLSLLLILLLVLLVALVVVFIITERKRRYERKRRAAHRRRRS